MRLEKHGRGVEQAWQMLDLFASLGAPTFDLTRTDMDGHKRSFRPAQSLEALRRWMPSLLSSVTQWQHNLIVRPKQSTAALVQLDDLRGTRLERVRSAAFLILTTSAGNHQAWVPVRECGPDVARRLRQRRRSERFRGHPRGGQPEFQAPVRAEFSHGADPGCESAAHSNTGRTGSLGPGGRARYGSSNAPQPWCPRQAIQSMAQLRALFAERTAGAPQR